MTMIALLSSMPFESDLLLSGIQNVHTSEFAGKIIYAGRLFNTSVALLNSGLGKVNAAHAATCVLESFKVKCIVSHGVGGAYEGVGLEVGDIAMATREILGDEGVIDSKGWHSLRKIGIPLVQNGRTKYFNEFPIAPPPIPPLVRGPACPVGRGKGGREDHPFKIKSGKFVTVSTASGSRKRARELRKGFNGICESMEGAAIAQVCALYKMPMLEIRGISNIAGVRDKRKWNMKLASENCQRVVMEIVKKF
jgi:futalosine hydrolase